MMINSFSICACMLFLHKGVFSARIADTLSSAEGGVAHSFKTSYAVFTDLLRICCMRLL